MMAPLSLSGSCICAIANFRFAAVRQCQNALPLCIRARSSMTAHIPSVQTRPGRESAALTAVAAPAERSALEALRAISHHEKLRRRQKPSGLNADDSLLIVRSGIVIVEATITGSTPVIMDVCYPGDVIAAQPGQTVSAFAATPAEVWRIKIADLAQAQARDPALATLMFKTMRSQTARAHMRCAIVSGLSSAERVAALLIEGALRLGINTERGPSFELPLTRVQIANMLALNADTLSRIMSRLTSDRIIARASRMLVTITDMDRLMAMCPLREAVVEHAAF